MEIPEEMRGCWISYIDIENNLKDLDEETYTKRINEMMSKLSENGINTVFFHVRPMGDAIYPSKLFHISRYISSNNTLYYDPLKIAIKAAHEKGISFHAWINPYRLSLGDDTTRYYKSTADYNTINNLIIEYNNSENETCLSLNPQLEATNMLICEGIKEIIYNYEVDGIHFDDYFYVYGIDEESDESKKMNTINKMVSESYDTVKRCSTLLAFGISPAGSMSYAKSQGADIYTWLTSDGYVDYIIPQIYWTDNYIMNGNNVSLYSDRCRQWAEIKRTGNKKIYVGLALYKVGQMYDDDLDWNRRDDNMSYQYNIAKENGFSGYVLFRYEWLEQKNSKTELSKLNSNFETAACSNMENDKIDVEKEITDKITHNLRKILKILLKSY